MFCNIGPRSSPVSGLAWIVVGVIWRKSMLANDPLLLWLRPTSDGSVAVSARFDDAGDADPDVWLSVSTVSLSSPTEEQTTWG
jgi:hypothetical protein